MSQVQTTSLNTTKVISYPGIKCVVACKGGHELERKMQEIKKEKKTLYNEYMRITEKKDTLERALNTKQRELEAICPHSKTYEVVWSGDREVTCALCGKDMSYVLI